MGNVAEAEKATGHREIVKQVQHLMKIEYIQNDMENSTLHDIDNAILKKKITIFLIGGYYIIKNRTKL